MVSLSSLQDCIQSENLEHLPLANLANAINNAFLEPMQEFDPFNPNDDQTNSMSDQPLDITTPLETYNKLKLRSTSKAPGPDEVPSFVYEEYAEILACPISSLFNCSLRHQLLPSLWKLAYVTYESIYWICRIQRIKSRFLSTPSQHLSHPTEPHSTSRPNIRFREYRQPLVHSTFNYRHLHRSQSVVLWPSTLRQVDRMRQKNCVWLSTCWLERFARDSEPSWSCSGWFH
jgi:hypothetical protein